MTVAKEPAATLRDRQVAIFAGSYFVTYLGDGIFYVCAALFFTQSLGVSPAAYGAVLTASWLVAMVLSVPVGHLADRTNPRNVTAIMLFFCGAAVATFVLFPSLIVFTAASIVLAIGTQGAHSARAAVIGRVFNPDIVTRVRAILTATSNAGLALGAAIGGIALQYSDPAIYRAVFLIDAATFILSGVMVCFTKMNQRSGVDSTLPQKNMLGVFRDRPYVGVTLANALLSLHITLIDVALPLWIVRETEAPTWSVAMVFIINTLLVVICQYRIAKGIKGVAIGVRRLRWAGLLLLAAMVLFGSAHLPTTPNDAVIILVAAAVVLTLGEMMHTSSMTEISFRLVPGQRFGQYQGFFGMGSSIAESLGPLLLTWIVLGHGMVGWIVLGAVLLMSALSVGVFTKLADRSTLKRDNFI